MTKHHHRQRGKPRRRRGDQQVPETAAVPVFPEHLPARDGESLVERIRRVTAVRDRQRAQCGHAEVIDLGKARQRRAP